MLLEMLKFAQGSVYAVYCLVILKLFKDINRSSWIPVAAQVAYAIALGGVEVC